jgi:hypothetical protein
MGVPPSVKTKEDYHKNFEDVNFGDLLRSLLDRHPGEPLIMSGVGTGGQMSPRRKAGTISKTGSRFSPGTLDSGFGRNDKFYGNSPFCEFIKNHFPG